MTIKRQDVFNKSKTVLDTTQVNRQESLPGRGWLIRENKACRATTRQHCLLPVHYIEIRNLTVV